MTRSEARAVYPRAYLYWSSGPKGQRCWSNKRGKQRGVLARAPLAQAPAVVKAQETIPAEKPLPYRPQWEWVFDTVAHPAEPPEEFSTFPPGEEPDVWPRLEIEPAHKNGMVLIVTLSAMALVLGIWLQKWRSRRLRITW